MYFASDSCNTRAVCGALMEKIRRQPGLVWLALVDGAFDHGRSGLALPNERRVLYDCDSMSDLMEASPFLLTLTVDDEPLLQRELATLVRHRKERPMLSFIGTSSTVFSVIENFRQFANAVTDDGQEFLLRFADTRVLPGLPDALRQTNWDGMTCLLSEWLLIDREGKLQELPLCAHRAPLQGRFQLSSAEFASLVTNSEPDAVIDAIAEGTSEALPEGNRATVYGTVANACRLAQRYKVHAFPDVVALAYLGLLDNGRGLRSAALTEMLASMQWEPGNLINSLVDFVE